MCFTTQSRSLTHVSNASYAPHNTDITKSQGHKSLRAICGKVSKFFKSVKPERHFQDSHGTWLPLDLKARHNEKKYGYRDFDTSALRFGRYCDSVERLIPEALHNAILDRYDEEFQAAQWQRMRAGICA